MGSSVSDEARASTHPCGWELTDEQIGRDWGTILPSPQMQISQGYQYLVSENCSLDVIKVNVANKWRKGRKFIAFSLASSISAYLRHWLDEYHHLYINIEIIQRNKSFTYSFLYPPGEDHGGSQDFSILSHKLQLFKITSPMGPGLPWRIYKVEQYYYRWNEHLRLQTCFCLGQMLKWKDTNLFQFLVMHVLPSIFIDNSMIYSVSCKL